MTLHVKFKQDVLEPIKPDKTEAVVKAQIEKAVGKIGYMRFSRKFSDSPGLRLRMH